MVGIMLTSARCLLIGSTNIKPKPLANTTPASAKSLDTIPMVEKHRIILPTATLLFQFSGLHILIYSQQNSKGAFLSDSMYQYTNIQVY